MEALDHDIRRGLGRRQAMAMGCIAWIRGDLRPPALRMMANARFLAQLLYMSAEK